MEARMGLDDFRVCLQKASAFGLNLFQLIEGGEDPIGEWPGKKAAREKTSTLTVGNSNQLVCPL